MAIQEVEPTRLLQFVLFYVLLVLVVGAGARALWLSLMAERNLGQTRSAITKTWGVGFMFAGFLLILLVATPIGFSMVEFRRIGFYAALLVEALGFWLLGSGFNVMIQSLRSLTGTRNLLVATVDSTGMTTLDIARKAIMDHLDREDLGPNDRLGFTIAKERLEQTNDA